MAKIYKLTKGGQTIYPATTTNAVVNPNTRKSLITELSELSGVIGLNLSSDGTVYDGLTNDALSKIPNYIASFIKAGFIVSVCTGINGKEKKNEYYQYVNERNVRERTNYKKILEEQYLENWEENGSNLKIEITAVPGMIIKSSDNRPFYRIVALDKNGFQLSEEISGINPNVSSSSAVVNDNEAVKKIRITKSGSYINQEVIIQNIPDLLIKSFEQIKGSIEYSEKLSSGNANLIQQEKTNRIADVEKLERGKLDIPKGKNLFNKNAPQVDNTDLSVTDKIIKDARFTSAGVIIKDAGYYLSPLIDVEPSTEYSLSIPINPTTRLFEFDSDGAKVDAPLIDNATTFVTQDTTSMVRFNFKSENLDTVSLEKGNEATPGQPYSVELLTQLDKEELEGRIAALEEIESGNKTFDNIILLPDKVYGLQYNANAVNFLTRLYPEGCLSEKNKAMINEGISCIVDYRDKSQTSLTAIRDFPIRLYTQGWQEYEKTIKYVQTKIENARGKKIIIMCIGDSLTDMGYAAVLQAIADMHSSIYSDITLLCAGTKIENIDVTLGETVYHVRGCNEGRGGWAISDYLRHAVQCRSRNGSTNNAMLVGKVAWDSLGLGSQKRDGSGGRDYQNFVYNEINGNLIRSTCHGYYDADPTEDLWNWIVKTRGLKSFSYNDRQYVFGESYSTNDDDAQIAAMKYICQNPDVPFYDYNTVQTSDGEYSFNFGVYLSRYKTLQDDGKTRLVKGSTAGSLVKDVNLYDVCTPTHVAIIMAYNDINNVVNGAEPVADDHYLMARLVKEYSSSIQCAVGCTHRYGAFYPARWAQLGFFPEIPSEPYTAKICKRMLELSRESVNNQYADYLPVYHCQSIYGGSEQRAMDTLDGVMRIRNNNADGLHADTPIDFLDRAYLLISWIYSTL